MNSALKRSQASYQMATQDIFTLKAAHPRTWRRATLDQRKQIVERYEQTGSVEKAFKGVSFSKLELSGFDTVGARRIS